MTTPAPRFKDRAFAAGLIARALAPYRDRRPLVLGIPRGGAAMADVLSRELAGDLDVALVRSLSAPGGSSLTLGAISESGVLVLREAWETDADESQLKREGDEALQTLRQRRNLYTPQALPLNPRGRLAIVVDDGESAAWVLTAALLSLRDAGAECVIAATAVATAETQEALRREADVLVCLRTLEEFTAPSTQFEDFQEMTDKQIREVLRKASRPFSHRGAG